MKPINDRPTPFVDSKASIRHHAYDRDEEVIQANDARTLEQMCGELHRVLEKTAPSCLCKNCVSERDAVLIDYHNLMKGKK